MLKTRAKFFVLILIIGTLIAYVGYYLYRYLDDKVFLSRLGGEIVYVHRDGDFLNIYKISANGKNKKILYHNEDEKNLNAMFPRWSEDKKTINFVAMKNGDWTNLKMDENGNNVSAGEGLADLMSVVSRAPDLAVRDGSIYFNNGNNEIKIYSFKNYDSKFNTGASEASWDQQKEFITFQSCTFFGCDIMIASKDGKKVVKLTDGQEPDWK